MKSDFEKATKQLWIIPSVFVRRSRTYLDSCQLPKVVAGLLHHHGIATASAGLHIDGPVVNLLILGCLTPNQAAVHHERRQNVTHCVCFSCLHNHKIQSTRLAFDTAQSWHLFCWLIALPRYVSRDAYAELRVVTAFFSNCLS